MKFAWLPFLSLALLSLVILFCSNETASAQSGKHEFNQQDRLFRHATLEQAWESAVANKKPLLVMFTSDNCVYCQKMLTKTYGHPAIKQMLVGQTESVLAHANDYGELVKRLGIRGFPTTLVISPQGEVLDVMEGFVEPRAFSQRVTPLLASKAAQSDEPAYDTSAANQSAGR